MQDLIKQLEYANESFPEEIVNEIINRKEEAIPHLLEVIRKVRDNPQQYVEDDDFCGHIYAIYLLAQFRVKELYPLFVDILNLPDEMSDEILGDVICDSGANILASVCFDDIQPIKDLIKNENIDDEIRRQGLLALAILVLHGNLNREDTLEYYRGLLNEGIKDYETYVITEIVNCCNYIYPKEVYEDIKRVFERDLVDGWYIDMKAIDFTLTLDKEEALGYFKCDTTMLFIDDAIDELKYWGCFYDECDECDGCDGCDMWGEWEEEEEEEEEEWNGCNGCDMWEECKGKEPKLAPQKKAPSLNSQTVVKDFKVGRNDPCPCGSGKKYKKCCGG